MKSINQLAPTGEDTTATDQRSWLRLENAGPSTWDAMISAAGPLS